ncbi:sigma-70 family RNA polymerase sigma factor [Candidatus Uhrbacteria bacterium]|nr:sigma-70 family RNA polymerase sigma factor [Candidatus Uhrbacteria bacterium]
MTVDPMTKPSFEAFYRANVKRIYAFVYFRIGGRKAMAEDLVQDIFLKAFEAFDRYDPDRGESAWIYTIARNHVINSMAKERPGIDIEDVLDSTAVSEDGRERMALNDDERHLVEAIDQLSKEDAQLVRMKYLEGWNFEDLGQVLGKSPGALRVQASRAVKKLKRFMKKPL